MKTVGMILLLIIIGALIGWVTNILAIKLMFRPIKPIRIPVLGIEIMGLIPKRKDEIARNIGQVIADELLSIDDLINAAITNEDKEKLLLSIKNKINGIVQEKINFIPGMFRAMAQGYIDSIINEELDGIIEDLTEEGIIKLKEKINIQQIVEEKINEFDLLELERIIISIAKKELKHIELLGALLGGMIGIIQGIIVMFL